MTPALRAVLAALAAKWEKHAETYGTLGLVDRHTGGVVYAEEEHAKDLRALLAAPDEGRPVKTDCGVLVWSHRDARGEWFVRCERDVGHPGACAPAPASPEPHLPAASPEPKGERRCVTCKTPIRKASSTDYCPTCEPRPASPPSPAPAKPCGCRHSTPGETLHPVFFPCPDHGSRKVASTAPSPAPEAAPLMWTNPATGQREPTPTQLNRERAERIAAETRAPAPSSPAPGKGEP